MNDKTIELSTNGARLDPNVKMPQAVTRGSANADNLHKQYYPKVAHAQDNAPSKGDTLQPPAPAPIHPAATPQPTQTAPTPTTTEQAPENWEHAFKSVNGRYKNATETLKNQNSKITDLETALAQRDAQIALLQAKPTTPSNSPSNDELTPQEVEEYGSEFLSVVEKKARSIAAGAISKLENKIVELTNKLNGFGQEAKKNARETMVEALDKQIPNWRQVNEDDGFMAWLGLKDTYSGIIRHDMLKQAWNSNDTNRVVSFFKGFISDEAATAPHSAQKGNGPDVVVPDNKKVPLENFAAPGRASSTGDAKPSPAGKPIITRAQIQQHTQDVIRGKYRGREADQHAIDLAIVEAAREGRIR